MKASLSGAGGGNAGDRDGGNPGDGDGGGGDGGNPGDGDGEGRDGGDAGDGDGEGSDGGNDGDGGGECDVYSILSGKVACTMEVPCQLYASMTTGRVESVRYVVPGSRLELSAASTSRRTMWSQLPSLASRPALNCTRFPLHVMRCARRTSVPATPSSAL